MAKTAQELANEIYKELSAQHSDLGRRIKGMQDEFDALEKRIVGLNDHVPLLHQLEQRIRDEVKAEQEAAMKPAVPINVTNLVDSPKNE